MTDFFNIKSGDIIKTDDGLLCVFDYMIDNSSFRSKVCNNIGDHICVGATHRILGYRYATTEERERLKSLCLRHNIIIKNNISVDYY